VLPLCYTAADKIIAVYFTFDRAVILFSNPHDCEPRVISRTRTTVSGSSQNSTAPHFAADGDVLVAEDSRKLPQHEDVVGGGGLGGT
jgi:hypothetical protein